MARNFDVISLGVLPLIDTVEGNQNVSQNAVNSWLGTYGSEADPLFNQVLTVTGGNFSGGDPTSYDLDNDISSESFSIEGLGAQTHDATMLFNATLTYKDGTTAQISAVVFQDTNGNTFLAPELSENADQAALTDKAIVSLSLDSPIYAFGRQGQAYSLTGERVFADFVCFASGVMILCEDGERPVETLEVGDHVRTLAGEDKPIRWIGRRRLDAEDLAQNPWLRPIRIRRGALGDGAPSRDLLVSPQHRIFLRSPIVERMTDADGCLTPAKHLLDLPGVEVAEDVTEVEYHHILLDEHEVLVADGAAAESLLAGPQALKTLSPEARREIAALLPGHLEAGGAPAPAYPLLSRRRAARLVARHRKNQRPVYRAA